MTSNQRASRSSLRLVFSATGENASDDLDQGAYELRLIDTSGMTAMRLALPADIVEPVVFAQREILVSMTPDGAVAAWPLDADVHNSPQKPIALDALVENAVTPQMLEDEPDAVRMLQTLHDRLKSAMSIVEAALGKLPE